MTKSVFPLYKLKTQDHLNRINKWTADKKMKLNISKTKNIIFNFSRNKQFSTEIKLDGEVIETVAETKLLGTIITNDLNWKKNTERIVKESNKRIFFFISCQSLQKISKILRKFTFYRSGANWSSPPCYGIAASQKDVKMILNESKSRP